MAKRWMMVAFAAAVLVAVAPDAAVAHQENVKEITKPKDPGLKENPACAVLKGLLKRAGIPEEAVNAACSRLEVKPPGSRKPKK